MNFELRGIFQKLRGLVVGDFSDMHDNQLAYGMDALEIIAERARNTRFRPCLVFRADIKNPISH